MRPIDAEFSEFPEDNPLWIFVLSKTLAADQERALATELKIELQDWASHQVPVKSHFQIFDHAVILITGYAAGKPSGCAIDSLYAKVSGLLKRHNLSEIRRPQIPVLRDGQITALSSDSLVRPEDSVIDTALHRLADFISKGLYIKQILPTGDTTTASNSTYTSLKN